MTETEWLASDDPIALMTGLKDRVSDRKCALFNIACARSLSAWWTDPALARMVAWDEEKADGGGGGGPVADEDAVCDAVSERCYALWAEAEAAFARHWQNDRGAAREAMVRYVAAAQVSSVSGMMEWWYWAHTLSSTAVPATANQLGDNIQLEIYREHIPVLRCVVGNPFRPVAADPAWLTADVVALARGIYDGRAFDRLPVLADALQDAGCENADVLAHCRGPGPHVRGCWVVDLLLGKT